MPETRHSTNLPDGVPNKYQFADWNSDGNTDLLYLDGTKMTVLLGDGSGNFQRELHRECRRHNRRLESTADLDGDGDRDVVLRSGRERADYR